MTTIKVRVGNQQAPPLDIEIEGFDSQGQPIQPVKFNCLRQIQGTTIMDAYDALETKAKDGVLGFLRNCVVEAEEPAFDALIHGKDVIVDFQSLVDLLYNLVEEYSKNPLRRPSDLPNGPSTTMPTSPVAATGLVANTQQPWMPPNSAVPSTV